MNCMKESYENKHIMIFNKQFCYFSIKILNFYYSSVILFNLSFTRLGNAMDKQPEEMIHLFNYLNNYSTSSLIL